MFFLAAMAVFALCLALLRGRYGHGWALRPFSLMAITASVYHGVSEVIIKASRAAATSRVDDTWAERGALVAASTLLVATLGYIATSPAKQVQPPDRAVLSRVFDWRPCAVILLPIFVLTARGQGFSVQQKTEMTASSGLAQQFFLPLIVLTAVAFVARHPKHLMPATITAAMAVVIVGQRLEIVVVVVSILVMARHLGIHIKWRQVAAVATIGAVLAMGISSVRSTTGRDASSCWRRRWRRGSGNGWPHDPEPWRER